MNDTASPPTRPSFLVRHRTEALLALVAVASSLLVYAPYLNDISVVYRVWDGPNYLTIAKAGYEGIRDDNPILAYVHTKDYFLRHFPLYPFLVRVFSPVGWQRSMLLVSVLSSALAAVLFFRLARDVWKLPSPAWLTVVFLLFPPRFLLFRSTGSTEAVFILLALASVSAFERGRVGWASVWAALASVTRISGLMILPAFGLVLLVRRRFRQIPWLLVVPLPLAAYFGYCWLRTGNVLDYLSQHADKLSPPQPFGFFPVLFKAGWYHVVEFYVLLFLVYAVGTARLYRRFEVLFSYCFFQLLLHLFVSTEDWSRYWLAMAPFALVVGFHELLVEKGFRIVFPVYVLAAYVYVWGTMPLNGAPQEMYARTLLSLGLWAEFVPPGTFGF
ncbi:hypothetical protein FBQ97_10310 [Acidobacteria bacterium ACD]|nr:MAG: hypothetical protein EDX89_14930 [Acidobacteriota bacterium]MDL1950191.1 hypothetical protein [Acidobacteria bacterium ACD]